MKRLSLNWLFKKYQLIRTDGKEIDPNDEYLYWKLKEMVMKII